MIRFRRLLVPFALLLLSMAGALPAAALPGSYTAEEIVNEGNRFFGGVSQGLASVVEESVSKYGLPNGYILGEEGAGAIFGGLRYGKGWLSTKNAGRHPIYWEGPTLGFDFGGNGDKVMMLVYNLPDVQSVYSRFPGVAGSAHIIAGFGVTVLGKEGITVVPIISGVGARVGVNFGYVKFTDHPTWNPF